MLTNRITDLEEWNAGEVVRMEDDFILTKESELTKGKEELQVDMGPVSYTHLQKEAQDMRRMLAWILLRSIPMEAI